MLFHLASLMLPFHRLGGEKMFVISLTEYSPKHWRFQVLYFIFETQSTFKSLLTANKRHTDVKTNVCIFGFLKAIAHSLNFHELSFVNSVQTSTCFKYLWNAAHFSVGFKISVCFIRSQRSHSVVEIMLNMRNHISTSTQNFFKNSQIVVQHFLVFCSWKVQIFSLCIYFIFLWNGRHSLAASNRIKLYYFESYWLMKVLL